MQQILSKSVFSLNLSIAQLSKAHASQHETSNRTCHHHEDTAGILQKQLRKLCLFLRQKTKVNKQRLIQTELERREKMASS